MMATNLFFKKIRQKREHDQWNGQQVCSHIEQNNKPNQSPNYEECRSNDPVTGRKVRVNRPQPSRTEMLPEEHFHKVKVTKKAPIHAALKHE
jgi:hypothetical protein